MNAEGAEMMKTVAILTTLALAAAATLTFADPGSGRGGMLERLKAADTNADGMISREEAKALPRIAAHFDEIDANKDGQITMEELPAFHASRHGDHPSPGETAPRARARPGGVRLRADHSVLPHPPDERGRAHGEYARGRPTGFRAARVVAARDAAHLEPAHRAHDALLARPLRNGPAEGPVRPAHVPPQRPAAARGAGQLPHAAARRRARSGDAGLPGQRQQPARGPERELRARGDGAVHARRGSLHRARREGGRARLHRMESRARDRRFSLPAPLAVPGREDRARPHR